MISFTLLTDTPARLRNRLLERGIIEQQVDQETGQTIYVGTRHGVEFVEVPNPIVVTPAVRVRGEPGYVPPVMDTRRVYLVKVAHAAEEHETEGLEQDDVDPETGRRSRRSVLLATKLGQWVMANSTPDTITSADGRSWPARNINDNFWLTITPDFGVWQ